VLHHKLGNTNGETKTTTFFIDDKIDTGAMILSSEIV
jgi:methionyl-tRNA formyltransferase